MKHSRISFSICEECVTCSALSRCFLFTLNVGNRGKRLNACVLWLPLTAECLNVNSVQKTDLRQSELGLLRGEEHCGLHRPWGDGADVGSQVRDAARPLIWRFRVINSDQSSWRPPGLRKHREKRRDKVSLSNNKTGGGRGFLYI